MCQFELGSSGSLKWNPRSGVIPPIDGLHCTRKFEMAAQTVLVQANGVMSKENRLAAIKEVKTQGRLVWANSEIGVKW